MMEDEEAGNVVDENSEGFWAGSSTGISADSADRPGQTPAQAGYPENVQRILDFQLPVTVSFGSSKRTLGEILKLAPGSLIELDKGADDPVMLKVNDKVFAWGRVVEIDGYYGIEITEVVNRRDRISSLGGV